MNFIKSHIVCRKCGSPAEWLVSPEQYRCTNKECDWWGVASQGEVKPSDRLFKKRYVPLFIALSIGFILLFVQNTQLYVQNEQMQKDITSLREKINNTTQRINVIRFGLMDCVEEDYKGKTNDEIDSLRQIKIYKKCLKNETERL